MEWNRPALKGYRALPFRGTEVDNDELTQAVLCGCVSVTYRQAVTRLCIGGIMLPPGGSWCALVRGTFCGVSSRYLLRLTLDLGDLILGIRVIEVQHHGALETPSAWLTSLDNGC